MLKNNRKLSRELSLGILLMAAPVLALSLGVLYKQSRKMIHNEVIECTNSTLNTTLHRIRNYMSTVETAANTNVWMCEENFSPQSLQNVSNRIVRLNRSVISSSVFAVPSTAQFSLYTVRQGDSVATYVEPEYDYLDKACYTQPVSSGNACWVDPFIDNVEGEVDYHEAIATYSQPVRQRDGRIVGVVTADLSFSRLAKTLSEGYHPYPHAYYMLLNGDGRYLIHPDTTRLFRKTIFTDVDPRRDQNIITLGHEMTAGKQGTMHIDLNGETYHVCYMPVPATNWSLALVCPDGDAMKSYYRLGYVIIALLVIGLLTILLLSNHVVKRLISPINMLIDSTERMADGQFDETIPVTSRKGVISQLQNSFAKMQQSLDQHIGCLQQDADEARQHNEEMAQANQKAEDIVRLKNTFIQHITQQMRMPLSVITGFADVLGQSLVDKDMITEEQLTSITGMMKGNFISMNRMLLMLLDATETDATGQSLCVRADEVSCNKISQVAVDHIVGHYPQAHIQFDTELHDDVYILTNRAFLLCVLIELLDNAVRHTNGSSITLHISQTPTDILFTIQDVGPGLPPDLPELVYKPFTKIDDLPKGVGLGLPLVRRYAAFLGGSMTIDADYHDGCRIVITMPK